MVTRSVTFWLESLDVTIVMSDRSNLRPISKVFCRQHIGELPGAYQGQLGSATLIITTLPCGFAYTKGQLLQLPNTY